MSFIGEQRKTNTNYVIEKAEFLYVLAGGLKILHYDLLAGLAPRDSGTCHFRLACQSRDVCPYHKSVTVTRLQTTHELEPP